MDDCSETYPIMRFSADEPRDSEPMGTKTKFWFERDGERWL